METRLRAVVVILLIAVLHAALLATDLAALLRFNEAGAYELPDDHVNILSSAAIAAGAVLLAPAGLAESAFPDLAGAVVPDNALTFAVGSLSYALAIYGVYWVLRRWWRRRKA